MIKFKNINGDVFLAVGSIKRKSALNGEKSLIGTLFEGDDVLNKIDKGWSLEFDNEPYMVTYFERNDNDNTVEFDAIHKFFWDMNKSVLYSSASGSHTAKWYLDQIFNGTGYTYALNFDPSAFEKENWGMKNKLSLFNDAISGMGGEFEINGTLVSIFKNVGSDLSTIVRHGFNLSDMSLENDNTDFVTYGEGFGAYADQENQTGERLHVTYTSPLAKTFGKLHAEPIDDQRYTIKDNLLQAIKDKVDGSFAISIKLSLYDLTAAGYPYKMANVGDWLLAIDENLDFKQKIRIISVDDEFATDSTRISYTVTCGDIGVVKKYQQANASLGQKVDSAYQNAQDAKESSIQAVIAANGKNTNYYVDGVENLSTTANDGDVTFVQTGDGQAMYIYTKLPDGSFKWVKRLDPDTGEQIAAGVDLAIETAQSQAAAMDEIRASEAAVFQSEANAALSSAAAERATFSSNAASMASSAATHADSMANSAAAYGKAQAASALSSANSALSEAKSDLTNGIASEASERQQAVQAVNSQAQSYANQAKSDAIEASKTADGVVRKDFKVTTDALSSTISQNKEDADGKISTAQTTATQALDGLSTKVSQTDYDKKTGDLSTAVNTVTQTATETKDELANVSKTVDSQSSKINTISNTVDGTTQTISDIQTEQGKQSGSIATLQSRADGFEATVTKVNNLAVGGRNLLIGTNSNAKSSLNPGNGSYTTQYVAFGNGYKYNFSYTTASTNWAVYMFSGLQKDKFTPNTDYVLSFMANVSTDIKPGVYFANGSANHNFVKQITSPTILSSNGDQKVVIQLRTNSSIPDESDQSLYINGFVNKIGTFSIWDLKIETGNVATDWSPAPEDLSGATAKAQLTADNAALAINNYKKDADGRISQAQADITATANAVSTKVSQSDYDTKTDDLTKKYGQVKATADAVTTDVINYKIANDKKVSANTASINTLNNQITSKVSQTDYDKETKDLEGKYSETKQTVDSISNIVTELQAKANAQGQVNQLMNTEFNPDLEGWSAETEVGGKPPYRSYWQPNIQATVIGFDTKNSPESSFARFRQDVQLASSPGTGHQISMSWYSYTNQTNYYNNLWLRFYDNAGNKVGESVNKWADPSSANNWNVQNKWEGIDVPDTAVKVNVSFEAREGTGAYLGHPMLVFGSTIGDYVPGNYNNNARVAALEVDINGITGLVKDPNKGLSATWNLASDGQSIAVQAKTAASTADGKAVAAQKDATTANTTANGVQTTVTNVQKDVKDLQSTTTQTAGQVTTEIEDRKNGDKSVRTDMANLIDQRITDTKKGYESAISQSADKIMASVSTPNQLLNTEFNPDLEGWSVSGTGSFKPYRSYIDNVIGSVSIGFGTVGAPANSVDNRIEQTISLASYGTGNKLSMRWDVRTTQNDNYTNLWLVFLDGNGQGINQSINHQWSGPVDNAWHEMKWENVQVPDNARQVRVSFQVRENTRQYLARPMLVFGSTIGSYMPGSYSGMNTSTVLELFKDNWALGIADNSGKIISGINGDTSNTRIVGKQIILDGDTTVTGDFYAKGGNFKNLNASNITTGTINAANINVINLDVSSLSGNITNFIKSYWNSAYSNVTLDASGMSITASSGSDTTISSLNATGAHFKHGNMTANYQFTPWKDSSGNATNAIGLNLGAVGNDNSYMNFVGTSGGSYMLYAGSNMNYGANTNIVKGELNIFSKVNIRDRLDFKSNPSHQSTYIESNERSRSLNFYTGEGSGSGAINYFWFNHNVSADGTFNGASLLSKKNIKSNFDTDALSEIAKTQLVNFEYKNNVGENHVSPIIDDINEEKQYYIPEKILSKDKEHVDMYSMISMAWKAIQQLNERMNS